MVSGLNWLQCYLIYGIFSPFSHWYLVMCQLATNNRDKWSEENEPQMNADERRFVASNPAHLIGSWDLEFFLYLSFSNVFASGMIRRVGLYDFVVIIFQEP